MDFNAVTISGRTRGGAHWKSRPVRIERKPGESWESAVARALAPAHFRLGGRFKPRRGQSGPRALIAGSRIPRYGAWLEAELVDAADALSAPVSILDLGIVR